MQSEASSEYGVIPGRAGSLAPRASAGVSAAPRRLLTAARSTLATVKRILFNSAGVSSAWRGLDHVRKRRNAQ
jgi:hypothetical protein